MAKNRSDINTESWIDPDRMCSEFRDWRIPDLIFLDIELGSTNGMIVSDHIREDIGNRYTSIVFISGKANMQ